MNYRLLAIIPLLVLFPKPHAFSQDTVEIRATGGTSLVYLDEPWAGAGGGSLHVRLAQSILVGAELLYIVGPLNQNVTTFMSTVSWEFLRTSLVRPYLIGGIGWSQTGRSAIPFSNTRRLSGNGGIGAKLRLSNRFFLAPEFRFGGDEPIILSTLSLGIRF
jgi:hypothetical protein